MSGMTSRNHVVAMEQLPLREFGVQAVVVMVGVNDLIKRLARDVEYDPDFLTRPTAYRTLIAETFSYEQRPDHERPWHERLALWRLYRRVRRWLGDDPPEAIALLQDKRGRAYVRWREHRRNASEYREVLPDLAPALDEYMRNLHRLADAVEVGDARPILVTQPTLWQPGLGAELQDLLWLGGIGPFTKEEGLPYYSVEALDRAMEAYNDTLLQVCRDRDVECIDLASMLSKDTSVFYDDVHFNENGARQVAAVISNYLLSHDLHHSGAR
jgi:hypothetical protein